MNIRNKQWPGVTTIILMKNKQEIPWIADNIAEGTVNTDRAQTIILHEETIGRCVCVQVLCELRFGERGRWNSQEPVELRTIPISACASLAHGCAFDVLS